MSALHLVIGKWRVRLLGLALMVGLIAWHAYDLAPPGLQDRTGRLKAPDFLQFYTYGALVAEGNTASLYDPGAHAEVARRRVDRRMTLTDFRPNYSPIIAWMASPLTRLPFEPAMWVMSALTVLLFAAGAALLAGCCVHVRRDYATLIVLLAAWPTWVAVIRYGQISALTLVLASSSTVAAAHGRQLLAGLFLGLLVYKPNLLLAPALVLAVTRHWRLLVGLSIGALAEFSVNLALVGPALMRQYFDVLISIASQPELVQFYPAESHSLRGFVRLIAPWPPLATAAGLLAIPVSGWLGVAVWRRHADWRPRWAALILVALLASPHLLTYDLLLLAIPIILLTDWWLEGFPVFQRPGWWVAVSMVYFSAWPGTFIARLFHVQISTLGMLMLLTLLARAGSVGTREAGSAARSNPSSTPNMSS